MEALLLAAWLAVAALLLGPPLLGVHRSTWPLGGESTDDSPESASRSEPSSAPGSSNPTPTPATTPTPVGRCRACGEDGQANYTYCRACLTPLPRPEEGADVDPESGHPAD